MDSEDRSQGIRLVRRRAARTSSVPRDPRLRFPQDQYAPGDRAVSHAEVETWKGSERPEDGPYPDTPMRSAARLIQGLRPGTLRS